MTVNFLINSYIWIHDAKMSVCSPFMLIREVENREIRVRKYKNQVLLRESDNHGQFLHPKV